ncbi:CocE/NonD family hydrolase [Rathayibacter sp. VKM Ac-2857]|uniref:CocE/NonD family hydrolase n=1 Tax=Rathayibacter sp. VKM Ac-2857 TaxID=2739020 RepID=UPI0015643460|nr:ABC transporter ATP-binding protein [Rathayibacter sp. VKM Ac-2857]
MSLTATPANAASGYTTQALHFAVAVGPDDSTKCDIIGDLYLPADTTSTNRVPALLTTNGWGASKDESAGLARGFAERGYAVLSYSGLGFGGSSCNVTIDDRDYDGKAASQLVSFLGGAAGIAYTDAAHTNAITPLNVIQKDQKDHDGVARPNDPRVGMFGMSYGGGAQFSAASVDHRIDTIIPMITWNDFSQALAPNDGVQTSVPGDTPGVAKTVWLSALLALQAKSWLTQPTDPQTIQGCPGLEDYFCQAVLSGLTTGSLTLDQISELREDSVASYITIIKVPVLLSHGLRDTVFPVNQAVATYKALKQQSTPVKMIWHEWGHDSGPVAGELTYENPDFTTEYLPQRYLNWFDFYLKGKKVDTGAGFEYFRDWVNYSGPAQPAYVKAPSYPSTNTAKKMYLSGAGGLVDSTSSILPGSQAFVTVGAGAPTSIEPAHAVSSLVPFTPLPELDLPGTAVAWSSATLSQPVDVVGIPKATLEVDAPTAQLTQGMGPSGQLVVFVKLLDVAPDGTATVINGLVSPVRIADVSKPVEVSLPGIVHRFAPGHQIRLVVSGGSLNYRGGVLPTPVTVSAGAGQSLTLPTTP